MESYALKVASPDDLVELDQTCPMCQHEGKLRMIDADIPLFKEIVIMAFTCDQCGYRNSEIKPSGEVSPKGRIHKLRVTRPEDLSRDVLKVWETLLLLLLLLLLSSLSSFSLTQVL